MNRAILHTLFAALAVAGCDGEAARTALVSADVSFLVPLTHTTRASTPGRFGTLVPRAHFDAIDRHEPLTLSDEPDTLYDHLQVVSVRLDPCFIEGGDDTPCASQVRLVLQPVFASAADDPSPTTRDAAMHAFYAVPQAELEALAQALARLRLADDLPSTVGVHASPEAAMALVLDRIGERRLTRITHMSVHASNEAWVFAGFDIDAANGRRADIQIPGGVQTEAHDFRYEQHLTSTGARLDLAATLIPEPVIEPDVAGFLDAERRKSLSAPAREAALAAVARLLDPSVHNPGTVDCASCHVATTAERFATRATRPDAVPAAYDDTRNQRMFGYFFATPSVSPRVLAETNAVVTRMNAFD